MYGDLLQIPCRSSKRPQRRRVAPDAAHRQIRDNPAEFPCSQEFKTAGQGISAAAEEPRLLQIPLQMQQNAPLFLAACTAAARR